MSVQVQGGSSEATANTGAAADRYLRSLVAKYAVGAGPGSVAARAANRVVPVVQRWAGDRLLGIEFSGSYAKGTAVSVTVDESHLSFAKDAKRRWGTAPGSGTRQGTDVDLFVSLHSTAGTVRDNYWSLFRWCADHELPPREGNVSVRVVSDGVRVDLVPGRKQKGATTDHTLYRSKADSWTQTNVGQHIRLVATSGRTNEIRAIKIWRERHRLDFPSFYLELSVIEALKTMPSDNLATNVWEALGYLAHRFPEARVVDPANSNNVISVDLGPEEKGTIARAAQRSLAASSWESVLW